MFHKITTTDICFAEYTRGSCITRKYRYKKLFFYSFDTNVFETL